MHFSGVLLLNRVKITPKWIIFTNGLATPLMIQFNCHTLNNCHVNSGSVYDQPSNKCMIANWSVDDQSGDQCMVSYVIIAWSATWSVHDQSRDPVSPLVNIRHAGGGWGPRQPWWPLPEGQHQCQKHSGFARKRIPQCGWAQEWAWGFCLGSSCAGCLGTANSSQAGKQVSELRLSHLPAVWPCKCHLTSPTFSC